MIFYNIYENSFDTYFFICNDIQNCMFEVIYNFECYTHPMSDATAIGEKIHESDWSIFLILKIEEI